MINRRTLLATAAATGTAGALAACSPSASKNDSGGGKGDKKLTFRLWDETAKKAYEESFAAFTKKHGWDVTIDVVPAAGGGSDLTWTMTGEKGLFGRLFYKVFPMEKMLAKDFDKGLAQLAVEAEKDAAKG